MGYEYTISLMITYLTHWGRLPHTGIYIGNLTIIDSDNGLSPGRRQAIIWTNAGILLFWILRNKFQWNLNRIHIFSFKKMRLKVSSAKWWPFCFGLNVLKQSAWLHQQKHFIKIIQLTLSGTLCAYFVIDFILHVQQLWCTDCLLCAVDKVINTWPPPLNMLNKDPFANNIKQNKSIVHNNAFMKKIARKIRQLNNAMVILYSRATCFHFIVSEVIYFCYFFPLHFVGMLILYPVPGDVFIVSSFLPPETSEWPTTTAKIWQTNSSGKDMYFKQKQGALWSRPRFWQAPDGAMALFSYTVKRLI